ncbi:MAG TPA: metal-sulfur cluster assembly factor [Actinomycetota bacterium]|nr:metal-sulfur cluster assembly factor [Actinomycetota bacterium]
MDEREFTMTEDASATSGATSPGEVTEAADAPVGTEDATAPSDAPVSVDAVREALKQVYDPELGLNIVDLGLVYDIQVSDAGDVDIQYSLTTMGCPIGPLIEDQMRAFLAPVDGVGEVRPEFVIRPAWTPEMMSDEAKAALGVF